MNDELAHARSQHPEESDAQLAHRVRYRRRHLKWRKIKDVFERHAPRLGNLLYKTVLTVAALKYLLLK